MDPEAKPSSIELLRAELSHAELLVSMVRDYHAFDHLEFDEALTRSLVLQVIDRPELGRLWLLRSGTEIAGYLLLGFGFSFEFRGRDAFVDEFFLKEPFRGKGLGEIALRLAVAEARSIGIKALHLEIERKNLNALRLYEKVGFEDHDRFLMTRWLDGEERQGGAR